MKRKLIVSVLLTAVCSICCFAGSVLGNFFGKAGLFTGAILGGIGGVVLATILFISKKRLHNSQLKPVIVFASLFFLVACLFATTNLFTPVIPLLSLIFVAVGVIFGMRSELIGNQNLLWKNAVAIFLLVPAIYFVIGSVFKYDFDFSNSFVLLDWFQQNDTRKFYFNLFSPVLFFGGCLLAAIMHLPVKFSAGMFQQLKPKNLFSNPRFSSPIVFTALLLLLIMSIYIIGETILSQAPE